MPETFNPYRDLPPMDEVLNALDVAGLPRPLLVQSARSALEQARAEIASGGEPDVIGLATDLVTGLRRAATHPVVNATGVLLHTNLGRAPLSSRAADAAHTAAASYTNVELDLGSGDRGGRGGYVRELLRALTGAEDALVVNNNAAAVLLALAATATGKAVPVSRGELIEIGGSYRLPLVMEAGGARLLEVGTTNRTRLGDFTTALQIHDCGAVLRVHPSNYRMEGFVEEAALEDLVVLAHQHDVPLIHDVGSGLIDASAPWLGARLPRWLADEPGVRQSIDAGADLVTFSGDKLIGGPQAGIIVGTGRMVERVRRHALARALRVDAMTDAALAATLESLANGNAEDIPFWRMATLTDAELGPRVERLAARIGNRVIAGESVIGAGSLPGVGIPTPQVALEGEDHLFGPLLATDHPILTRRQGKDLLIDLRAVAPDDDELVAEMVARCR
ncbi:MAG TPA: L-seryl-tRNA(Sec) selenium transferase [Acidimicrobiia bacterium]|nr:L-seryl-tRNA(Sec) selenium transferase [Acidimicrobiia bacterium]